MYESGQIKLNDVSIITIVGAFEILDLQKNLTQ